ncbi:DUF927 domain-containing protein [Novosphingobium sp. KCTC 2891]|uniref:DUF927 domain-containing protein n=1 Tax=Novosphingobium sp. KCTC 2891 TaxID=2989730 RepID=UPI00222205CA|nr:DUF927 domain-containing protein [Novosphingobium sp. KCTC 2891]MCW1383926.1 DUF927 domain-containing protein [Novosphingobium sp. KCTC 2891]
MTKTDINSALGQNLPMVTGLIDPKGSKWVLTKYNGASALLPYGAFVQSRSQLLSTLSQHGVVIIPKAAKDSFMEQVGELEEFSPRVIFSRPGWHQGQFATVSGKVYAPSKTTKGLIGFETNPIKCARKGTHSAWLQLVAGPLAGHHIPVFAIMACFAAPMLSVVGRADNFGFELSGAGGKGKSTTQRLMASVVGPAMEKNQGYITTFNMTHVALDEAMRSHSDMPFIIDEANLFGLGTGGRADDRAMRDFSFQMGSGVTKGKFGRVNQEGYRFIFVTSANEPFHELLGRAHRDTANAASDRLISISIPEEDSGVFGPLPSGYQSYRAFTLALETAMVAQYGTAMPKFLRALVRSRHKNEAKFVGALNRRIATFKQHVGVNENNGSDVRVAEAFGLVYAAGEYARHTGVLPKEYDCLAAASHCYSNYRGTVPVRQSLPDRLKAIIERPETRAVDRAALPTLSDEELEAIGAFIRVVKGETLLLMTPSFGGRMLPDWRSLMGTPAFQRLNKADKNGRGRGYHCRVRANSKVDWFYAFKIDPIDASA